jgi:hypothetical protein
MVVRGGHAVSVNNTLDRTLHDGRTTAHPATRQYSLMIGFSFGRNTIAAFLHQKHRQPAAA